MDLVPASGGPTRGDDRLDGYYRAGGMSADSVARRHRAMLRRIAMETMNEMGVVASGTPSGEALLLGIIDGLDEISLLEHDLGAAA